MALGSPRKAQGIILKAIKEKSLSSKSEDDEKMSKDELTRFARKFKYMKFFFKKSNKESNDDKNGGMINQKIEKGVKKKV